MSPAHGEINASADSAFGAEDGDFSEAAAPALTAVPGGKKSRNSFTGYEVGQQVDQVSEWLTAGYRPNEIRRLCSEEWGLSSRVADSRLRDARNLLVQDVNAYDRREKAGQMMNQLEEILKISIQTKQCSNAIGAVRLMADLLQLTGRK
jgi:hypothetical protein